VQFIRTVLGHSLEFLLESESSASPPQDLQSILANLSQLSDLDLSALMSLQRGTIRPQLKTVEVHCAIADAILRLGEPLIAYDVLSAGLKSWPQDLQLRQWMALALARSGATISANALLQQLVSEGQRDEKTLGLLARTHKDLWSQTRDHQIQASHLALAAGHYEQAYRIISSQNE
jgi:predicted Zn-dependent protease